MRTFILVSFALLVCNVIYCGLGVIADFRHSRPAHGALCLLALSGALMALTGIIWAVLAS